MLSLPKIHETFGITCLCLDVVIYAKLLFANTLSLFFNFALVVQFAQSVENFRRSFEFVVEHQRIRQDAVNAQFDVSLLHFGVVDE